MTIDFSKVFLNYQSDETGKVTSGSVSITIEETLEIFKGIQVQAHGIEDVIANGLGLFTISTNVKGSEVVFGKFGEMSYITKDTPTGCTRTATGALKFNTNKATLTGRHIFLEYCNMELLNSCWRTAFIGQGNDITNPLKTPAGQLAFYNFIDTAIRGMGNDFGKETWWGGHGIITTALTNNPLKLSKAFIARVTASLLSTTGILTTADTLGSIGETNFDGVIPTGEIDGWKYKGDAMKLIRSADNKMKKDWGGALNSLNYWQRRPICCVSRSIFQRLTEQLELKYTNIPAQYYYNFTGSFFDNEMPELKGQTAPGVLIWDNKVIVECPQWQFLGKELGFYEHRLFMTVAGNLGVGLDIQPANDNTDFGLIIEKAPGLSNGGKWEAEANYRRATMIIDPDFCVNIQTMAVMS